MTSETEGSGTPGIPDVSTGSGGEGGSPVTPAADPFSGLDTGIREWIGKAGFKMDDVPGLVSGLATKARSAEGLIGRSVQIPGQDAKPEEWDAFHSKVAETLRPKEPTGYEFKLPEGVPEGMPYNGEFADQFKSWAHDAGLSPKQAAALHDKFVAMQAQGFSAQQAAMDAKAETATASLEKLFGAEMGSPKYQEAVSYVARAVDGLGGDELKASLQAAGLLGEGGVILDASIAKAFHAAGLAMFKEDTLTGGASGAANPWAKGSENYTEQSRLIRENPERARAFMATAGVDPKRFGLG